MTRLCPAEFKKFLLYARQMEIRGVDLDAPYYNYIISFTVPDIDNVTVLDYDAREERVYWSDVRTQAIKRAFINGTGVETVVSAGSGPALHPEAHASHIPCDPDAPSPNLISSPFFNPRSPGTTLSSTYNPGNTNHRLFICAPRLAQRPWAGRGLGVPKSVLDELRHQQEADQRGPARRLLQECCGAGPGAAPRPGRPPSSWVSSQPGLGHTSVRREEEDP